MPQSAAGRKPKWAPAPEVVLRLPLTDARLAACLPADLLASVTPFLAAAAELKSAALACRAWLETISDVRRPGAALTWRLAVRHRFGEMRSLPPEHAQPWLLRGHVSTVELLTGDLHSEEVANAQRCIEHAASCVRARTLSITSAAITWRTLDLSSLAQLQSLHTLQLTMAVQWHYSAQFTVGGWSREQMTQLGALKSLRKIVGLWLAEGALTQILACAQLPHVDCIEITSPCAKNLASLAAMSTLTDCTLKDLSPALYYWIPRMASLQRLCLFSSEMDTRPDRNANLLPLSPRLHTLQMHRFNFSSAELTALLSPLPLLTNLTLGRPGRLTHLDLTCLAPAAPHLHALKIAGCDHTPEDTVDQLKRMPHLQRFTLNSGHLVWSPQQRAQLFAALPALERFVSSDDSLTKQPIVLERQRSPVAAASD